LSQMRSVPAGYVADRTPNVTDRTPNAPVAISRGEFGRTAPRTETERAARKNADARQMTSPINGKLGGRNNRKPTANPGGRHAKRIDLAVWARLGNGIDEETARKLGVSSKTLARRKQAQGAI